MSEAREFYDQRAASYDAEMDEPRSHLLRRAFWGVVERYAPPDKPILDFGCGTGVDAARYVELGFRVLAFDVSLGMVDRLRERCVTECSSGEVVPVVGYEALREALPNFEEIGTLTANFAVLSHLADLNEFRRLVREELPALRAIVVSVQNPFFVRDVARGWWWRGLRRARGRGSVDYWDGETPTRRYLISRIGDAVGPGFALREQLSHVRGRIRGRFPLNRMGHMRILAFARLS